MSKGKSKLLSLLLCVLCLFCGCNLNDEKTYQGRMTIPAEGTVAQTVFEQIKNDSAVVVFTGESNGHAYEWAVFGEEIEKPQELNLAVEILAEQENELLSFRFCAEEALDFSPVLSIHLNSHWDCRNATVYNEKNEAVCGASVTGNEKSILNFSVCAQTGTFTVRADREAADTATAAEKTTDTPTEASKPEDKSANADPYLSPAAQNKPDADKSNAESAAPAEKRVISNGAATEQDQYLTDPVPAGKPMPTEPENAEIDKQKMYTCTFSIECSTILNNLEKLEPEKLDVLPSNGVILPACEVTFYEGESVYDVLQRVCKEREIHMEASWTPIYNSAYVEGIHNLYEFDCGNLSGWMYRVNGWYPNYGCSRYQLTDGEVVEWRYTCDLGNDVGGGYAVGGT